MLKSTYHDTLSLNLNKFDVRLEQFFAFYNFQVCCFTNLRLLALHDSGNCGSITARITLCLVRGEGVSVVTPIDCLRPSLLKS